MVKLKVIQGGRIASRPAAKTSRRPAPHLEVVGASSRPQRVTADAEKTAAVWGAPMVALAHWNGAVSLGALASTLGWLQVAATIEFCAAAAARHPHVATIERLRWGSGSRQAGARVSGSDAAPERLGKITAVEARCLTPTSRIEVARLRWGVSCVY
jgi:hypothetical protein